MTVPRVLVIGGGIAGMVASLGVAEAGFHVYLVERRPWIGGRMAQLDKTFPTLDCASCIITPRMVAVGSHPLVHLLTLCEVVKVEGEAGAFRVTVKRRPRYVDESKCTACGRCADACRLKGRIPKEFDMGLGSRGAIYLAFPQAVPMKYAVDPERCLQVSRGRCGKDGPRCVEVCPNDAIDFGQREEVFELEVGSIVVATGYDPFPAQAKPEYGYGRLEGVITILELERMLSASGPTEGEITVGGREPEGVVFIHCVGSRDHQVGNPYCSRVCCTVVAKQALALKERFPGARVVVCYMDVRTFGKGYEAFYERVQRAGVIYRRGLPAEVFRRDGKLVVRGEDTLLGRPYEEEADLVVLATGIRPSEGTAELASVLGLELDDYGFLQEADPHDPLVSPRPGVFLAGCCQGPKDIPDTVAQASGAASRALALIRGGSSG